MQAPMGTPFLPGSARAQARATVPKFRNTQPGGKSPAGAITRSETSRTPSSFRLAEIRVAVRLDLAPQLLERARWTRRTQGRQVAEAGADRVAELREGAAEQPA